MAAKSPSPGNDLVIRRVERGTSATFERLDEPRPGTYWRLLQSVTGHECGKQVQAPKMQAGTVLLLEDVEYADGEPHVYQFAAHPNVPEKHAYESRFHADCFFQYWTYCPEGAQVREQELLNVHQKMQESQALLMQPPPVATPVGALGFDPSTAAPAEGQALATPGQVRDLANYAEQLRENAEASKKWIATHSSALQAQGEKLARFYSERATVALAAAKGQLDAVKGILRTVENLKVYTGEDVAVTVLRAGAPAAADAPLTIYQDLLALDEELLLHLEEDGLDHTHLDSIAAVLTDDTLVRRMLPAERSLVLCKFRGGYKEFVKPKGSGDIGAAIANEHLNRINQCHRLLLRDGEQIYLIDTADFLQKITQLMPSAAEQIEHFANRSGDTIRRDDIAYAKAQRSQLGALDAYAKVLTALWGLRDRGVVLANWNVPAFASWLDWGFQESYLHLVDQSNLIGVQRPSFDTYRDEQNRYLAPGAWVAVRTSALIKQEFLPGAFASQETRQWRGEWDYSRIYRVKDTRPIVTCVRQDKRGIYVEVPLVHEYKSREINGRMYLEKQAMADVLVLDRLHGADLTYYLTSRTERRRYNLYVELFQVARAWVAERDRAEAPLRDYLRQAVADGRVHHDPENLEAAITDALATARAARRDRRAPDPENTGFPAYRRALLDTLHTLLSAQHDRVDALQRWCNAHDRRPLRLVSTGKGKFKAYLEPLPAEHDRMLGEARHTAVATVTFEGATGAATLADWHRELLRPAAGEHVIHDWQYLTVIPANPAGEYHERLERTRDDGAAAWLKAACPFGPLRYEQARALLQLPAKQSEHFHNGLDMDWLLDRALGSKGKYIVRHAYEFAVGIVHSGVKPCVLIASHDMLGYVYSAGSATEKERVKHLITSRYKTPWQALADLENGEQGWSLRYVGLEDVWRCRDEPHCLALGATRAIGEALIVDPALSVKENMGRKLRCVGLTTVGAALFPWLAQRTESAL
ncbi:hypothetical protein K7574_21185 (plasmid) [Stenotrophomonas maltophilia]|uniref:hypothetical protein n=1 Tax=Stenotrophomonas maltophilia TaxID=40324 RepID=UPI001D0CD8D3|nr:hypothetical protein [Stenotrophomonas maltophilia]UXF74610.1 hypothetical protein K7574_21185 [Stenotrophomonas maltophilia]